MRDLTKIKPKEALKYKFLTEIIVADRDVRNKLLFRNLLDREARKHGLEGSDELFYTIRNLPSSGVLMSINIYYEVNVI